MLGSLGNIIFVASAEQLRTFTGFSRTGAPRVHEHEVIGLKARPEFLAQGVEAIQFQVRLDKFFGMNPEAECTALRKERDAGTILPLVIGGKFLGEFYIVSLSEAHTRHDGKGKPIIITVDISLKEVPNE